MTLEGQGVRVAADKVVGGDEQFVEGAADNTANVAILPKDGTGTTATVTILSDTEAVCDGFSMTLEGDVLFLEMTEEGSRLSGFYFRAD